MKSKALIGIAAGMLSWSFAVAQGVSTYEPMPSIELLNTHLYTLDRFNHGMHMWGPLPNPETPYTSAEVGKNDFSQDMKDRKNHLADVNQAREQVWIADSRVREDFRMAQAERQSLIDRTGTVTSIGRSSTRSGSGSVGGGTTRY